MNEKTSVIKTVAPLVFVAVLFFVLATSAGLFVLPRLLTFNGNNNGELTDCNFIWEKRDEDFEKDMPIFKVANSEVGVQKESGMSYVRMNYTIPAHQKERLLQITSGNHPVKVVLNGKEIYSNNYPAADFTANKLNNAIIPAANTEQMLDIYIKAPFAFYAKTTLNVKKADVFGWNMLKYAGLALGIAAALTGLIMTIAVLLFFIRSKQFVNLLTFSLVTMLTGFSFSLSQAGLYLDRLTSPLVYKLQFALPLIIFSIISYITLRIPVKRKTYAYILPILLFVFSLIFINTSNSLLIKLGVIAAPMLIFAAMLFVSINLAELILKNTERVSLVFVLYLLTSFQLIFDYIRLIDGTISYLHEVKYIGMFIYIGITLMVLLRLAIDIDVRQNERQIQIEKDTLWISRVISLNADVFLQREKKAFIIQAAKSIRELIYNDVEENMHLNNGGNFNVYICIGIKENGDFVEIMNDGAIKSCDYNIIELTAKKKKYANILFGGTYMDLMLYENSEVVAILHFEGMEKGLSGNIKNIVNIAHTNIRYAFDNMILKKDLNETQENVFIDIAEIAEKKSENTGKHLKTVSELVRLICYELNMSEHEASIVSAASMVHDIGKLAIPEEIIAKKGELTELEYNIVKQHTTYGYNMLSKSPGEFMEAGAIIALQHHEKYDGTGYIGLKGENIHLYARITALVDVLDALLSERPYKPAWTFEEVSSFINQESGKHFDPRIVRAFNSIGEKIYSTYIRLNAGERVG